MVKLSVGESVKKHTRSAKWCELKTLKHRADTDHKKKQVQLKYQNK